MTAEREALEMKSMILLTAMAMACLGCAHTQQPERKVHIISEDAGGIGSPGGHDCADEQIRSPKKAQKKRGFIQLAAISPLHMSYTLRS